MTEPIPIDPKIAAGMDLENAELAGTLFISFLADVGANLQRDFPQYASMLPRSFIWTGAAKIGRDAGPEAAAEVLEQIAGLIRDGHALDPEAPIPTQTPPGTNYN